MTQAEELVRKCQHDLSHVASAREIAYQELDRGVYDTVYAFRDAAYDDMALFSSFFLGESNLVPLEPATHHHAFYSSYRAGWGDELLNFIAPRHSAKTTVGMKVTAIHGACYFNADGWKARDPQQMTGHPFTVVCSASSRKAEGDLTTIKAAIEFSELISAAFAHPIGRKSLRVKSDKGYFKWNENEIVLANGAQINAIGRGGQLRGITNHMNFRPTLFIGDDLEGEKNVTNDQLIEDTRVWFYNAVLPGVMDEPSYKGRVIVLGTVVHDQCLVNRLRFKDPSFKTLFFQIIMRNENGEDVPLWPGKNSLRSIYQQRESYERRGRLNAWLQEYMNIAMSKEERPFRPEQIQYFDGDFTLTDTPGLGLLHLKRVEKHDKKMREDMPEYVPVNTYIGVDFSSSDTAKSDFTAMVVIAVDARANCYMLDSVHARLVIPSARWEALAGLVKKYRPIKTIIESIGDQNATFMYFREMQRTDNLWFSMYGEKHHSSGSKIDRITGTLEPRFNSGAFFFRHLGQADVIQEFIEFPQAAHDDYPDGIEMAVRYSRRCPHTTLPDGPHIGRERDEEVEYDALTAA
jgi:predicted phage terminase large subunit-like protein